MDNRSADRIYFKLSRSIPDARPELIYKNEFELLIAVMLSAQTTDKAVNAVTRPLFAKYGSARSMYELGENKLRALIKPIGLAPTKAKNIIRASRILLDKHDGQVPASREALNELPGVGRKTANVVLNEAFGQPTLAVDTHVFRVANRTGLATAKTVEDAEAQLLKITPEKWLKTAHRLLILHGRYVCKAKKFDCSACVIKEECRFPRKNLSATDLHEQQKK